MPIDLLALDEALDQLAAAEPVAAQVVMVRYVAGRTIDETAAELGISVRTANRHWAFAKAWLYRRLGEPGATPEYFLCRRMA
jgi:DNA-directed RNA polymerase specialized sigma24 family protein